MSARKMTVGEAKKILRSMKSGSLDEVIIGRHDICRPDSYYMIRIHEENRDPYEECSWITGWRAKWIIEHLLKGGEIVVK